MELPYAEVIGDPVAHSKSPLIHRFWLEELGLGADYRATRVSEGGLAAYFEARRRDPLWCGCNITMPHKDAATGFITPQTVHGPINLAVPHPDSRWLRGENTDVVAFETLLRRSLAGGAPSSRAAAVIGTGGLAASLLPVMEGLGFDTIHLLARSRHKAEALAWQMGCLPIKVASLEEPLPDVGLLVNASALGMAGIGGRPPALDRLPDDAIVFEAVYAPPETELLAAARRRGLRTIDGFAMLIEQAAPAFRLFYGRLPPRGRDSALQDKLSR